MSWSEDDPGQGSPDGIAALALLLGEVADAAASAQSNLQKLKDQASDAIWRGPAADAFHSRIDKLPGHLEQLAKSYDDARSGFKTYSAAVADIKQKQQSYQAQINQAQSEHTSASQQQANYVPPDGGASGATTKNPYDDAVAAAASRLSAATGKLHALADDRRTADSHVKGSLKDAHNDGMKNKSGWAHFWDAVSQVLAVIAIVLIVIAVIAVCVAFPEAIAAFIAADGLLASLAAGGSVLATAAFGGALGTAMTVVGVLSLGAEAGQYANGEGSLTHLLFDTALTVGPFALLKGARYLSESGILLRDADEASNGARAADGALGGWKGEDGLTLSSSDSAAVDAFLSRSAGHEPAITNDITDITKQIPGAKNEGLDFRLKGGDSLKRKVATDMLDDGKSASQALSGIKDSVRYTVSVDGANYRAGTEQAVQALQAKGYQPVTFKNTWDSPGYKGINSTWRDPATGQTFEVQFHTPQSFDAKMTTHQLYEEQRLPSTDPLRAAELQIQQSEIFSQVPIPAGAGSITAGP